MKAVVYNKRGSPEKLSYCDVDKPVPDDNTVLVKTHAVSVNAADYRSMKMGFIPKRKIFGADIAGCIESVGKNITQFKVGDEVMGDLASFGFGGFAEYVTAPEKALIIKPVKISSEDGAALPISAYKKILTPNGIYVMVGGSLSQIFKSLLFGWLLSFGSKKIEYNCTEFKY
ncbi:MAG: alcohol dehydrogenase catalytic domain-containing protein [Bacteroidetes bacterium]|nr:alcohol dehydrogenase catalytic domain-containing protein [Bacteroidota bacterium]